MRDADLAVTFGGDLTAWPLMLVDIGSRGGIHPRWRRALPHLRVLAFEPGEDTNARHFGPGIIERTPVGLYDRTGTMTFFTTGRPDASSLLEPNRGWLRRFGGAERYEIVAVGEVQVDTLDAQLRRRSVSYVDFVKLDTQGSELAILRSAHEILTRSILGVELEVNFGPRYTGQAFFADVDEFLRFLGFQLFDIEPRYWKRAVGLRYGKSKGQLVYGNALYLRDAESLQTLVASDASGRRTRVSVLHAIVVAGLYGYIDLAVEIFSAFSDRFSATERAAFMTWARRQTPWNARIPNIKGRGRIALLLSRLSRLIQPISDRGISGGDPLGNV